MRPHTPTINTARPGVNVNSPPETPTTGSPKFNRKAGAGSHGRTGRGAPHRSSMTPLGGVGSQFNYTGTRGFRPEEISPRSSDSSDEDSESSTSPPSSPLLDLPDIPSISRFTSTHVVVEAAFEIEECSSDDDDDEEDAMDSDDDDEDRPHVLRPYGFEYPESERSRSRQSTEHEVDPQLMNMFQSTDLFQSDDSDFSDDDEVQREITRRRELKKMRRLTSGSISKRTISERGSDSDREDLQPWDTGEPLQRRIRRKTDRRSLLSIPTEIIIELKEPNSDGEIVWDEHEIDLARELPFWTMEVDSD